MDCLNGHSGRVNTVQWVHRLHCGEFTVRNLIPSLCSELFQHSIKCSVEDVCCLDALKATAPPLNAISVI